LHPAQPLASSKQQPRERRWALTTRVDFRDLLERYKHVAEVPAESLHGYVLRADGLILDLVRQGARPTADESALRITRRQADYWFVPNNSIDPARPFIVNERLVMTAADIAKHRLHRDRSYTFDLPIPPELREAVRDAWRTAELGGGRRGGWHRLTQSRLATAAATGLIILGGQLGLSLLETSRQAIGGSTVAAVKAITTGRKPAPQAAQPDPSDLLKALRQLQQTADQNRLQLHQLTQQLAREHDRNVPLRRSGDPSR
jgi:hypothetical protein